MDKRLEYSNFPEELCSYGLHALSRDEYIFLGTDLLMRIPIGSDIPIMINFIETLIETHIFDVNTPTSIFIPPLPGNLTFNEVDEYVPKFLINTLKDLESYNLPLVHAAYLGSDRLFSFAPFEKTYARLGIAYLIALLHHADQFCYFLESSTIMFSDILVIHDLTHLPEFIPEEIKLIVLNPHDGGLWNELYEFSLWLKKTSCRVTGISVRGMNLIYPETVDEKMQCARCLKILLSHCSYLDLSRTSISRDARFFSFLCQTPFFHVMGIGDRIFNILWWKNLDDGLFESFALRYKKSVLEFELLSKLHYW